MPAIEGDPAREWQRIQKVYAQMSDELQSVAAEAYDLTDIARQVLQAEIKSRGSDIQLSTEPAPVLQSEPDSDELVFKSLGRDTTDDIVLDAKFNWHCDASGYDWRTTESKRKINFAT
jgi:hypothetical protein